MNIHLKITDEEFGRFLSAYYRSVFGPLTLGQAFLVYYGLLGYNSLRYAKNDDNALDIIKEEFLGRLN